MSSSVENDRARVCMEALAKHKVVQRIRGPIWIVNDTLKRTSKKELDELTLRLEARGAQKHFLAIRQKLENIVEDRPWSTKTGFLRVR